METRLDSDSAGSQLSPNMMIAIISSLFILVILYPWIIAVSVISFILGFSGLEPIDQFIKTSISSGRFGELVQARFKDYINQTGDSESQRNVITEVTADPLRDLIEQVEQKNATSTLQQQQQLDQENDIILQKVIQTSQQLSGGINPVVFESCVGGHNTLIIPNRLSSSSRSSPEKNKPNLLLDSPKRSLSAASSRRVSEDIPGQAHSLIQQPFALVGGVSGIYPQKRETPTTNNSTSNNKTPSPSRSSTPSKSPSPSITLNPEIVGALRVDQEFRVNIRIDKAFGRMFTNIIDYYISPSWAPYETRRQLKLSLRQLLNRVAEQCNRKLLYHHKGNVDSEKEYPVNAPVVKLAREKLLPLALYYLDKTLARGVCSKNEEENPIISTESKRRIVLKIRKFCMKIAEKFLNKDDRNCKLWMELCVAVLADGVLVNVMHLGRDKLPELLEELVLRFKKSTRRTCTSVVQPSSPTLKQRPPSQMESIKDDNEFVDPLSEDFVEALQEQPPAEVEKSMEIIRGDTPTTSNSPLPPSTEAYVEETATNTAPPPPEKVPFLLDSFLDPPFNLEKPDPIVSRWRPTLKDIVSETDLLYPLIQYMKHVGGQQSLAYLQGILDEFPNDGDPYCRRILELEYLPGFCRSSLFLETMGLSRVEMAFEVGADLYSMMRRNSSAGHARSASYGGPSSSSFREFLKIEQGIVDGLPLPEASQQNASISSSSSDQSSTGTGGSATGSATATLPFAGEIQPNLAFKRRPHLEMYIAKFIKSTSKSWKQYYDPLAENYEVAKRAGIEAKSYQEWDHPEVNSRVKIDSSTAEMYDCLIDLVSSLMRSSPIASPFFSGLSYFIKPYLMPIFNEQLEKNLTQLLSEDLLVTVVDLIADVYEEPSDVTDHTKNDSPHHHPTTHDNGLYNNRTDEYGNGSYSSISAEVSGNNTTPPISPNNNASEEESQYHNSSCTTCDPSFKSTIESFLSYVLECFMLKLIDLDYFVKCFSKNREYIFLFFVDLLDVLVAELVEE